MSELDFKQRFNHIRHKWNNCYYPSINLMMNHGYVDTILMILLPIMEHLLILENYKKEGKLLDKANWKDVHRFFFGESLNDEELNWVIRNFYQCIRHSGIQWQTFRNFEIKDESGKIVSIPVVFDIMSIKDENKIWLININEKLFIENAVAIIENYFNDIPLPNGIPNQLYSRIRMCFSETPLEKNPYDTY